MKVRRSISAWMTCAALLVWVAEADGQAIDERLWGVSSTFTAAALCRVDHTLFVGGSFRDVGPNSGGGVPFDVRSAKPHADYPKVAGFVDVVVSDGRGGWFVGGQFNGVGGRRRVNLGRILPNGTVAEWSLDADDKVVALAYDGRRLYVGGFFRHLGDSARAGLAAIDCVTGRVLPWHPDVAGLVGAIAVSDSTIYVGGSFSEVDGQLRSSLAAFRKRDGKLTAWSPDANSMVRALLLSGRTLYVGGDFWALAGEVRLCVGAVDVVTGAATAWNPAARNTGGGPPAPNTVETLALGHGSIYVGGRFNTIGGATRVSIAEVDTSLGAATPWNPNVPADSLSGSPLIHAVCMQGDAVYIGGGFRKFAGQERSYCVAVDSRSGDLHAWDPRVNEAVYALAANGSTVYVAGAFASVDTWEPRRCLAAFDLRTGRALPWWDAQVDGFVVHALAAGPRLLYLAGTFWSVGGQPRSGLAAIDRTTGQVTDWNPMPDGTVYSIAVSDSAVYVGGWFSYIGGQSRLYVAALDPTTGEALPWNPGASNVVETVLLRDTTLYLGGFFRRVAGQVRNSLAAVDARTGQVREWQPETNGAVLALGSGEDALYVGGAFDTLGGELRRNLGAVDLATGRATAWVQDVDDFVRAIETSNGIVVYGGFFEHVGVAERPHLAAASASGELLDWSPGTDGNVWALTSGPGTVYAGGGFRSCDVIAASNLAGIAAPSGWQPPPPGPDSSRLALLQNTPNPANTVTTMRFRVPSASEVSLAVYDLQGRVQSRLLHRAVLAPGVHEVSTSVASWPVGCYWYRLEVGGEAATRKMLVLR